jgi:hypothetical protein
MTRSFALTFAGVTLRVEMMPLVMLFGETTGYEIVAWTCWLLNLLVAEAILAGWFRRKRTRALTGEPAN